MIIVYLGPIKIVPEIRLINGIFNLYDLASSQSLGYANWVRGKVVLVYNLNHLHPMTQALVRSKLSWSSLMSIREREIWRGTTVYNHAENTLVSLLTRD